MSNTYGDFSISFVLEDHLISKVRKIPGYEKASVSLLDDVDYSKVTREETKPILQIEVDGKPVEEFEVLRVQKMVQHKRNISDVFLRLHNFLQKKDPDSFGLELDNLVMIGHPFASVVVYSFLFVAAIVGVYYFFV